MFDKGVSYISDCAAQRRSTSLVVAKAGYESVLGLFRTRVADR